METSARSVTVIPPTINIRTHLPELHITKRRVAGYARVSTDKDEQFTSYAAQIDYYTRFIQAREDWQFVDVYTDEGISGLNTKKRDGFNTMIRDALAGKIDLIVTKSVSRFARNTVDSLVTIRKLKEHNVECYFEKENIFTFDGKGELLLTIMSSLAQEESRSISENVTWGQRKRFADGKVCMPYSRFLGYEKGEDGSPVVNEAEAEIVRAIYRLYLSGKTARGICLELEEWGVPSPGGSEKWSPTTVRSILKNEKYKGDALLQKKYTVDFLSKKMKANEGEIPQYYVENSHPAIIDPIEFDMVQVEIARRKQLGRAYSGNSVFSSKLICADCGGFYGQKVWHSNDAHRRVIWQCNSKFKNAKRCTTPHLDAETVQWMFLGAYDRFMGSREQVIADCEIVSETLCDCTELDTEIAKVREEIEVIAELVKKSVAQNASAEQSQEDYMKHYNSLVKRFEKAKRKLDALNVEKARRQSKDKEMRLFIATLQEQPLALDAWDERLWIALVKKGTVHPGGMIVFTFKDGTEIEVEPK